MGWFDYVKPLNIAGVDKVNRKDYHIARRVFWLLLVLASTSATVYVLYSRIGSEQIRKNPSLSKLTPPQFPALTICAEHLGTSATVDENDMKSAMWNIQKKRIKKHGGVDIWHCKWGADRCPDSLGVSVKKNTDWGMCANLNMNGKLFAKTGGLTEALVLYLFYAGPTAYMYPEPSLGFRMSVHEPGHKSMILHDSTAVPAGALSEYAITLKNETFLPEKIGCMDAATNEEKHHGKYSFTGCIFNCMHKMADDKFKCCPAEEVRPEWFPCGKTTCKIEDELRFADFLARNQSIIFNKCRKNCPRRCHRQSYIGEYSWQPLNDEIFEDFEVAQKKTDKNFNMTRYEMQERIAAVTIFYRTLTYQVVTQSEALTIAGLMSDIGGAFALWMGVKVLGVVAMVEIVIEKFTSKKKKAKKEADKNGNEATPVNNEAESLSSNQNDVNLQMDAITPAVEAGDHTTATQNNESVRL